MKPVFAPLLCRVVAGTVFFVLLAGGGALAHVSSDDMPDSVAEVEYAIFLEFRPDDPVVRNKLGMVYFRLNKLEEAVREFGRVLQRDPKNYDALDGMGLVQAARHDFAAAIGYHRQAIAVNADDMMGYYHLGSALEKKGELREALEAYRTALARFTAQEQPGRDNAKAAAEFGETIRAAIRGIESNL
jgi:tetratricopeptide (TPR) repeat protein